MVLPWAVQRLFLRLVMPEGLLGKLVGVVPEEDVGVVGVVSRCGISVGIGRLERTSRAIIPGLESERCLFFVAWYSIVKFSLVKIGDEGGKN